MSFTEVPGGLTVLRRRRDLANSLTWGDAEIPGSAGIGIGVWIGSGDPRKRHRQHSSGDSSNNELFEDGALLLTKVDDAAGRRAPCARRSGPI